jgi:LmbE family N-acetylglucosaminyl deacetylase
VIAQPQALISPLTDPLILPLRAATTARAFGPTLIVAPHQDDESLGCGGLIALLRSYSLPVTVLFVSDGTGSHPQSRAFPADRLRDTREAEAREALQILGVAPDAAAFLRFRDTAVPMEDTADFAAAAERVRQVIDKDRPATIVLPWRRDPHCDHRAAWQLIRAALARQQNQPRLLEYPIWVWELAGAGDLPFAGEVEGWRLDITAVLEQKQQAIAAHRSQLGQVIDDDPNGFCLLPHVLQHFTHPWEIYLESSPQPASADKGTR